MKIRLFGFEFVLEYSFLLILCFAIVFNADDLERLLLFSALHETGHIIALLLFGGKIDKLTLSFYGLALKYSTRLGNFREAVVIACGPLVNLILYLILKDDINLLLFLLNTAPVFPLDGGRIAKIIFPFFSKYISAAALILISALAVYSVIAFKSFSLALISCYLIVYSINY